MARARSPFPGMDPYLEDPRGWRGVHASFLTYLCDAIAERLPGRYYARPEDRVYLDAEGPAALMPDARVAERGGPLARGSTVADSAEGAVLVSVEPEEVHEHFIEVRDASTGDRVVTVIELLSPTNKRADSDGGRSYKRKQAEILASDANLVEIDLLRGGDHVVAVPRASARARCGAYDYLVVARRASRPEIRELYANRLQGRLPRIAVPLREGDADIVTELQPVVDRVYAMGSYGSTIDYAKAADPPLADEAAAWARGVVAG